MINNKPAKVLEKEIYKLIRDYFYASDRNDLIVNLLTIPQLYLDKEKLPDIPALEAILNKVNVMQRYLEHLIKYEKNKK